MMDRKPMSRRRKAVLMPLVCLSLCTNGTAGFQASVLSTTSSTSSRRNTPHHLPLPRRSTSRISSTGRDRFFNEMDNSASSSSSSSLRMARRSPRASSSAAVAPESSSSSSSERKFPPLLTAEEERELLQQAVEFKRISSLEKEMQIQSPTKAMPLLSIRANAAGYGEDLDSYEQARDVGQKARETLVTRNMGLVYHCVNKIVGKAGRGGTGKAKLNSLSREDLIQEGAIGLARAVDKWNPEIGNRFSSYAVYWVRAAVLRCIAERDDIVRVPGHVSQAVIQINKAAKRLGFNLDADASLLDSLGYKSNPRWEEASAAKRLAEEAGLSQRNFEEAMKVRKRRYSGGYVAFESWMQRGENMLSDVPTSSSSATATTVASSFRGTGDENDGLSSIRTEELRQTLSQFLKPREIEALSWRYGLIDVSATSSDDTTEESPKKRAQRYLAETEEKIFGPIGSMSNSASAVAAPAAAAAATSSRVKAKSAAPAYSSGPAIKQGRYGEAMTFDEVGKRMQVSAEYTRRLCHAALAKLRAAAEDGQLEPALLVR